MAIARWGLIISLVGFVVICVVAALVAGLRQFCQRRAAASAAMEMEAARNEARNASSRTATAHYGIVAH
jgi:hypothetical protein